MSKLAKELDVFFNRILVLAEHQNELLLGHCQSDLELTNADEEYQKFPMGKANKVLPNDTRISVV
ncbi:hypothetical protein HMPREF9176_0097 [Streptococcus downei F0415]|uniref:Zn(2+)-responsive AdcR transcriptional repressor n=1 Tax=Streptococcus downei MFe28 TaxID=764290 RepID=A0A380JCJ5_STRDO|nr:hypothetical protein HMPREF9176_0097 [Streptococcus downei F0415]SUN35573.1 Zn(2+)-responsive AdcR transcriptional repressor [Streptococcus downei MFe28]